MSGRTPEYNRHHILFPERIWKEILGEHQDFRGVFVVRMRSTQHERLHRLLNSFLKENLTEADFPRASTLSSLAYDYELQKERFRFMNIHQKIDWLLRELNPSDKRNRLLIKMLKRQRSFLKYYKIS